MPRKLRKSKEAPDPALDDAQRRVAKQVKEDGYRRARLKIDPVTGKPYPKPAGGERPLQGPDGKFLKGNRSGYAKGQCGNPGGVNPYGRPRRLAYAVNEYLHRPLDGETQSRFDLEDGSDRADGIAAVLVDKATAGSIAAIQEIRFQCAALHDPKSEMDRDELLRRCREKGWSTERAETLLREAFFRVFETLESEHA